MLGIFTTDYSLCVLTILNQYHKSVTLTTLQYYAVSRGIFDEVWKLRPLYYFLQWILCSVHNVVFKFHCWVSFWQIVHIYGMLLITSNAPTLTWSRNLYMWYNTIVWDMNQLCAIDIYLPNYKPRLLFPKWWS